MCLTRDTLSKDVVETCRGKFHYNHQILLNLDYLSSLGLLVIHIDIVVLNDLFVMLKPFHDFSLSNRLRVEAFLDEFQCILLRSVIILSFDDTSKSAFTQDLRILLCSRVARVVRLYEDIFYNPVILRIFVKPLEAPQRAVAS